MTPQEAQSTVTKQTRGRRRVKFEFWLDANKDDQARLGDRLWRLKSKRKFAPTLRKAVRLFFDLLDGQTNVLRQLFPALVRQIESDAYQRGRESVDSYEVQQLRQLMQRLETKIEAESTKKSVFAPMQAVPKLPKSDTQDNREPVTIEEDFDAFDDLSF